MFIAEQPAHPYFIEGLLAKTTSELLHLQNSNELEVLILNRNIRRELLTAYQTFMALHIQDFGEIKSLPILQEVLS